MAESCPSLRRQAHEPRRDAVVRGSARSSCWRRACGGCCASRSFRWRASRSEAKSRTTTQSPCAPTWRRNWRAISSRSTWRGARAAFESVPWVRRAQLRRAYPGSLTSRPVRRRSRRRDGPPECGQSCAPRPRHPGSARCSARWHPASTAEWVHVGLISSDPLHVGRDPRAGLIPEDPLRGDRARRDAANGLPGRSSGRRLRLRCRNLASYV